MVMWKWNQRIRYVNCTLVNISHSLIVEKLSTQLKKWSPLINAVIIKMSGRINEQKVCEFMIKWS